MTLSELDLIKFCKEYNAAAQKLLYEQHVHAVIRLCLRYINQPSDVEDITQLTFEKVLRKIVDFEFKGPGSLKAWIHKIAVNECLMHIRKDKQQPWELITNEDQLADIVQEEEIQMEETKSLKQILECIHQLPPGYKIVLNMYVFDKMKHEEIAQHLNIIINTSKSQLSRARLLLKKLLNNPK